MGWIALFFVVEAVVFAIQIPLRRRRSGVLNGILWLVKIAAVVALACWFISSRSWILWHNDMLVGIVYLVLFGDVLADLAMAIIRVARGVEMRTRKFIGLYAALTLVFGFCFGFYGTVNSQTVQQTTYRVTSPKLANAHTFAFMSDLHVGNAQQTKVLADTIDRINADAPNFVILGGDVVDDFTTKAEMEEAFGMLRALRPPVYFVYGNHDRQPNADFANGRQFTEQELEAAMARNRITALTEDYVQVANDLVLLGREDYTFKGRRLNTEDLVVENPDPSAFLLLAEHEPQDYADIISTGADLQICGHTHAGQLFPAGQACSLLGINSYGRYKVGDTEQIVSSGQSGWQIPLRTSKRCEYVLVTLAPE